MTKHRSSGRSGKVLDDPYAIHEPETPKIDALRYLQMIYRDPQLSTGVRMRAAIAALNYETPRLAVQALITEQDIATVLDRRIAHYQELQRANGSKVIEAKDKKKFAGAFDRLTASCNACHQASKKEFIRIQRPTGNPYTNQAFAPPRK